ncbi:peptidase M24, structural domain-containing protein [Baffinella frigidus]|nr:peptidase M24, structural domain-containing protein [Cryptophyta sp. CCMP2293]
MTCRGGGTELGIRLTPELRRPPLLRSGFFNARASSPLLKVNYPTKFSAHFSKVNYLTNVNSLQESNFHYLFGVEHPGCFGTISLSDGSSTLFVPRQPEAYTVWMGPPPSLEQVRATYKVDTARYVDELPKFLAESAPPLLHLYSGVNTDSGSKGTPAHFDGIDQYTREASPPPHTTLVALHTALYESRVIKSPDEIAVLRFASKVASQGHIEVMKQCRPGMMEYQLEAVFGHHCYMHGGMRSLAYTPIAGAGLNAAVLHYGHAGAPNNREIGDGDMILSDMGAEYYCYASDITCSYPANGKFTPDQRSVYLAVLECLRTVESHMKPGTSYVEMHQLVEKTLAKHLIGMGVLTGDLDEIVAAELPAVFMPHGLGHNLGLDTHDVGGYPLGSIRATRPGLRALRNVRTLKEGMMLAVEPGCHFILPVHARLVLSECAKFMNAERIAGLRAFGGVRLEDNVVVTRDGHEVLTHVPREIEEVRFPGRDPGRDGVFVDHLSLKWRVAYCAPASPYCRDLRPAGGQLLRGGGGGRRIP